jgi:hypothetical protein
MFPIVSSPAPTVMTRRTTSSELYRIMIHPTPASIKTDVDNPSVFSWEGTRSTPVSPQIPLNKNTGAEAWSLAAYNGFTPLPSLNRYSPAEEGKFDYLLFASSVILKGSGQQGGNRSVNSSTPKPLYTADAMAKMNQPLIKTPLGFNAEQLSWKRKNPSDSKANRHPKKAVVARMARDALTTKESRSNHQPFAFGGEVIQVTPMESEWFTKAGNEMASNDENRPPLEAWGAVKPGYTLRVLPPNQQAPVTGGPPMSQRYIVVPKTGQTISRVAIAHTPTKASAAKVLQKIRSCSCKNSRCLKLYCDCFSSSEFCDPRICKCSNCQNNNKNKEARNAARAFCLSKNKNAFAIDKMTRKEQRDALLRSQPTAPPQACSCTKSKCLRKYCGCFFLGFFCSEMCGCVSCANIPSAQDGSKTPAAV